MSPRNLLILALAVGLLSGCYRLTPVETSSPERGLDVRVGLTDEGSVRLASLIGPRIGAIDGRVLEAPDTAIVLAVEAVVAQGGRSMAWSQERLAVPRTAIASLRTRTLDRKKTWIVAGLSVVGIVALGDVFGIGGGLGGVINIGGGGRK
jgi:hypothetical protein